MATKKGGKAKQNDRDDHNHNMDKMQEQIDDQELEHLYAWVDGIPLSRPKRNISRDFSDGVLVAEVVKHYFHDGVVELHNYTPTQASSKKKENWFYLNRKVFSKMNFELAEDVINDLVCCRPGMIEKVLLMLKVKIQRAEYAKHRMNDKPEADQHQMTPGRKDGKPMRVGLEDTKGSRFQKTKHHHQHHQDSKSPGKQTTSTGGKRRTGPMVESDMVPRYLMEEKEQDILARDETIQILSDKVARLEYLIQMKDHRVDELKKRLEQQQATQLFQVHDQLQQQQQQYQQQQQHYHQQQQQQQQHPQYQQQQRQQQKRQHHQQQHQQYSGSQRMPPYNAHQQHH